MEVNKQNLFKFITTNYKSGINDSIDIAHFYGTDNRDELVYNIGLEKKVSEINDDYLKSIKVNVKKIMVIYSYIKSIMTS